MLVGTYNEKVYRSTEVREIMYNRKKYFFILLKVIIFFIHIM